MIDKTNLLLQRNNKVNKLKISKFHSLEIKILYCMQIY